jgi:hypothetical protein
MALDMLDRLTLDAGIRTLGELLPERVGGGRKLHTFGGPKLHTR